MKRSLLLALVSLASSAIFAQNTVPVSNLFASSTNWDGASIDADGVITFTKSYNGAGYAAWSGVNLDDYATVTAEVSAPTGDLTQAQIFVQYVEDTSVETKNTKNVVSGYVDIAAEGTTKIVVELDKTIGWDVWQILVQSDKET